MKWILMAFLLVGCSERRMLILHDARGCLYVGSIEQGVANADLKAVLDAEGKPVCNADK